MVDWPRTIRSALVSGTYASVASTSALAVAALMEGKAAVQPINATSHWLNGEQAASYKRFDLAHTAVGYATNHAASIFWAVFFELWLERRSVGSRSIVPDALVMSAIAAAVDYGPTPNRFTPGWESVLSKKGMAFAYAGLAFGLGAGAMLTRSGRRRRT